MAGVGAPRPASCPDPSCSPLNSFIGLGEEAEFCCIGVLAVPRDHGGIKGINDLSWCMGSGGFGRWLMNRDDLVSFFILAAGALKKKGIPFPKWMLDEIYRWGV